MSTPNPIEALIAHWPTRQAFASEVGAKTDAVHKWAKYGRIPSQWQQATVEAARRLGVEYVTPEWMLAVHASREAAE